MILADWIYVSRLVRAQSVMEVQSPSMCLYLITVRLLDLACLAREWTIASIAGGCPGVMPGSDGLYFCIL
jgi:hypothetical protein